MQSLTNDILHLDDVGHVICPSPGEIAPCKIHCPDAFGILDTLTNDWNIWQCKLQKQRTHIQYISEGFLNDLGK